MPLPFIVAGATAGLVGSKKHLEAKKKNNEAKIIIERSKALYEQSYSDLEKAKEYCKSSLKELGSYKQYVLNISMNVFLSAYEKIKDIKLSESVGITELESFCFRDNDYMQIKELSGIYSDSLLKSAGGAATGALISFAASGILPILASDIGFATTLFSMGEVGLAAEILGGGLSTGLSIGITSTPLAAIVAPVLLFTAFSATSKAEENYEKALVTEQEVKVAVERMRTAEIMCYALGDRAKTFYEVLKELNKIFQAKTLAVRKIIYHIEEDGKNIKDQIRLLPRDDLEQIAMLRSLAGAVKAIIDTPIMSKDGTLSKESQKLILDMKGKEKAYNVDIGYEKSASTMNEAEIIKYCSEIKAEKFWNRLKTTVEMFSPNVVTNEALISNFWTSAEKYKGWDLQKNSFAHDNRYGESIRILDSQNRIRYFGPAVFVKNEIAAWVFSDKA